LAPQKGASLCPLLKNLPNSRGFGRFVPVFVREAPPVYSTSMLQIFSRRALVPCLWVAGALLWPGAISLAHAQNSPSASIGGATIQTVNGALITLGAGTNEGVAVGQTLPVFRLGSVVALVKITAVQANSATGNVIYTQGIATLSTSDVVSLPSASLAPPFPSGSPPSTGTGQGATSGGNATGGQGAPTGEQGAPPAGGVFVPFETGASNESVPKADRTYELLATLAAQGLIKSQPARVFQDDGARRHRYAEDLIFSRAQIAVFIREALDNAGGSQSKGAAALAILTRDFRKDLLDIGVKEDRLAPYGEKLSLGVSGFLRARGVGGDTGRNSIQPFDERFGAGRISSGADVRLNLFGSLSRELNFYGSVDTGSRVQSGLGTQTQVRKAYVSYNAAKILRGLTIDVGRKEYYWGVGTFGTGLLGDAGGGLDSLSTRFERGSYRFDTLYAPLGKGPNGQQRSLYGHNLSVEIGRQSRVGLSETILRPNSAFNARDFLGALTPVSLYLVDRPKLDEAANSNTNSVISAYGETAVARGMRTYGEIVLDDIAINGKNRIENRTGSTFGVQLFNPRNPARAGITGEYTRTNSLFYLQFNGIQNRNPNYEYYFRGAPLGFPIVPSFPATTGGSESLRFEGYYQPIRKLTLFGGVQFADINSEDQMAALTGARGFSRQQVFRLAASYDLARNFSLTARAQRVASDQPNFIKGEPSVSNKTFSIEIAHSF